MHSLIYFLIKRQLIFKIVFQIICVQLKKRNLHNFPFIYIDSVIMFQRDKRMYKCINHPATISCLPDVKGQPRRTKCHHHTMATQMRTRTTRTRRCLYRSCRQSRVLQQRENRQKSEHETTADHPHHMLMTQKSTREEQLSGVPATVREKGFNNIHSLSLCFL